MNLTDTIIADIGKISADLNNPTFDWNSETYSCAPGAAGESAVLEVGGLALTCDCILVVPANQFADGILPKEQNIIAYKNKNYRILKVTQEPLGAFLRLFLGSPHRGI